MNIRKRTLGAGIFTFLAAATAMAQRAKPKYDHFWLPDQATTAAGQIDDLFYLILWITGGVFVLVFVLMVYFLIRYRSRSGRKATYYHGNTRLEIIWTIVPALMVIALGFLSKSVWSQIKTEVPDSKTSLVIDVKPRQFQWDITYTGADGQFGTPDDITTINQLHVPVNKDVVIRMTAQDVIHSFFVPEFRVKQDAVPGMVTQLWFNVPKPGSFEIACAELCGLGHYRMRGYLTVYDQAGYDAWYAQEVEKKAAQLAPPPPADTAAAAPADTAAATSDTTTAAAASGTDTTAGTAADTAR
jgi:cytochrome c oxidase subunit 2